jgi:hypothetical protein
MYRLLIDFQNAPSPKFEEGSGPYLIRISTSGSDALRTLLL